ncbi:MAG: M3 family metallopeptidase [Phycisphaerales bacterium JB063]
MTATSTATPTDLADNPLMVKAGYPALDRIAPEHVVPGVEHRLSELTDRLEALEASLEAGAEPTWDSVLKPLEDIGQSFSYFWSPIGHLLGVKNTDELRAEHEKVQPKVVQFSLRMGQSKPIYDALVKLRDGAAWDSFSRAQQRVIEQKIRAAEHAGVALEGDAKKRFLEISEKLSQLSTDFSNHVLDATKAYELIITDQADTTGWPKTLKTGTAQSYNQKHKPDTDATPDAGPWRITLDYPSFVPFMQHCRNRTLREQVYKAYTTRASDGKLDNTDIIAQTLKLRQERAKLLGYEHHAALSLSTKMAKDVDAVAKISNDVRDAASKTAGSDLDALRELAQESGQSEPLEHWDLSFWAERLREKKFDYTDEQLRPYFPMPRVLDGLFGVCTKLFGTTFERDDAAAPRWNDDVQYYHIKNEQGQTVAGFYLDPYSRPENKRGGAWMDIALNRRVIDGQVVNPIIYNICNGTPPVGDPAKGGTPSLMSFAEVETLFHEFGHALQGMLTTVDCADVAGVEGVEWDAVEICSQFMENWCYHKPTLIGMTKHVETGEPLPDDLFDKITAARTFRMGSRYMRQLEFGVTDMTLHSTYDPNGTKTAQDVHFDIANDYSPLPPSKDNRFLNAFGHIFGGGYSAGYYSYLWSDVLCADCFSAFEEAGLDNEDQVAKIGRRFRDTFLALGGGEDPAVVFEQFRGRGPTTDAFLRINGLG